MVFFSLITTAFSSIFYGIIVTAALQMPVIQFTLLHSWPVTLLVIIGIEGYLFKLSHDLKNNLSEGL